MASYVSQAEKELMWKLYQKYGTYKAVADKLNRNPGTVSRHVREYEAAVNAASVVMNAK
ncbi:helix-turn-helix domain-containing protein [Pseudoflavonifractor phocaeensis]|uniref:helix-turn-helix domain-containing protein n=1 Tax=Pseudoflavonifractor phocaeensis TaxID=1870988 RepID=UPI001F38B864|nr:helix-turn-helix domain-containing protein [Pseudoflavonifractor phocaeensis]MCF2596986.1 helix-turn-helix domain-containing protein [Pseudoflavonifractor phocaeensis]